MQVKKHRLARRFERHYLEADELVLESPFGVSLPLGPMIFDQEHRYAGVEEIDGIPCHRLRFEPRPESPGASVEERLGYAAKGELCVSTRGDRLMQVAVETVREVASSTLRVRSLAFRFESRPQGEVWLPASFDISADMKALGVNHRQHNTYRYSDYRAP